MYNGGISNFQPVIDESGWMWLRFCKALVTRLFYRITKIFHISSICSSFCDTRHCRRLSQMIYQPKSVGKMVDFETLSLNSNQMCDSFCKDLVTG